MTDNNLTLMPKGADLGPTPTLRDQFAMAALPYCLTFDYEIVGAARYAYYAADAMMEARK